MLEIVGTLPSDQQHELHRFAAALEGHPLGDAAVGRLVIADPRPGGLRPTMRHVLQQYMKDREYETWLAQQAGRPVTTAGKTFVADDDLVTACVCPIPDARAMLALCAHEIVEVVHRATEIREGWRAPEEHEVNGTTLADEYVADRLRIEIAQGLDWPVNPLDADPGLVGQTDDVNGVLAEPPYEGSPTLEFWQHWVNLARVWGMVAGRADAGAVSELAELERWADRDLIADNGWRPVRDALRALYSTRPDRDAFIAAAVANVWDRIEAYGREAWASG